MSVLLLLLLLPLCGSASERSLTFLVVVVVVDNGLLVTVTVVDRCVACAEFDLDFSPGAFAQLAVLAAGHVDIEWGFV